MMRQIKSFYYMSEVRSCVQASGIRTTDCLRFPWKRGFAAPLAEVSKLKEAGAWRVAPSVH